MIALFVAISVVTLPRYQFQGHGSGSLAQMGLMYCVNFNRSSYQTSETHAEVW